MSGKPPLDNTIVDNRISNRNIIRISDYINIDTKIEWECKVCSYIWNATPDKILNKKTGCPKCSKRIKLSKEIVDERVKEFNIIRLQDFKIASDKIQWRCLKDNHIWLAKVNDVNLGYTGCPLCSKHKGGMKCTNNDVDKILKNRDIIRLDDYINNKTKIKWNCLKCNNKWLATPNSVLNCESGCPVCRYTYEKKINNFLHSENIEFELHKYLKINDKKIFVDFFIKDKNIFIEYNGEHHYKPTRYFKMPRQEAELNFLKQVERDNLLRNYCLINNFKLLEISYKLNFEDIKKRIKEFIYDQ